MVTDLPVTRVSEAPSTEAVKVSSATGSGLLSVLSTYSSAFLASSDSFPSRTTGTPSNRPDSGTSTLMVLASTGLNKACNVTSGSLSVRPSLSEGALKVAWTVPASRSTNRTPSAPVKFPVPFQARCTSNFLPSDDKPPEPALSRWAARGTTMTSLETTAGPTVTFKVAPAVDTVRVTP